MRYESDSSGQLEAFCSTVEIVEATRLIQRTIRPMDSRLEISKKLRMILESKTPYTIRTEIPLGPLGNLNIDWMGKTKEYRLSYSPGNGTANPEKYDLVKKAFEEASAVFS